MTMIDTPEGIRAWQLLSWRSRLKLEIKGLKFKDGSTYAFIKREFGLKGSRESVLKQYEALLIKEGYLKDADTES
jgi:hypothetical protein